MSGLQIGGVILGILATIVLSVGDDLVNMCTDKDNKIDDSI